MLDYFLLSMDTWQTKSWSASYMEETQYVRRLQ